MKSEIDIEAYVDGAWQQALTVTVDEPKKGAAQRTILNFHQEYLIRYLKDHRGDIASSVPVDPWPEAMDHWPAFLIDLIPQGASRKKTLDQLKITGPDGPHNDWLLLERGASNPPGNLRVAQAAQTMLPRYEGHPGFPCQAIIERREDFLDYAQEHGASVAGSSGAQGEAPKFLLTEDIHGLWHADGVLPDELAKGHFLVKFPRGKTQRDHLILETEALYHKFARWFGAKTYGELSFDDGILFVPRFDRKVLEDNRVERYGLESFYSALDIIEHGRSVSLDSMLGMLEQQSVSGSDLVEFVIRDMLNVALKNTDNHGRNHALLKKEGYTRISPLFDFAPMYLDEAGIARVCRWEHETAGESPDWWRIAEQMVDLRVVPDLILSHYKTSEMKLREAPNKLSALGVHREIIERVSLSCEKVHASLLTALPKVEVMVNR